MAHSREYTFYHVKWLIPGSAHFTMWNGSFYGVHILPCGMAHSRECTFYHAEWLIPRSAYLTMQNGLFQGVMLGDIGDIKKLRVCAGREDDDNPVWMVEQVSVTHLAALWSTQCSHLLLILLP